jgi:hypothetical protein
MTIPLMKNSSTCSSCSSQQADAPLSHALSLSHTHDSPRMCGSHRRQTHFSTSCNTLSTVCCCCPPFSFSLVNCCPKCCTLYCTACCFMQNCVKRCACQQLQAGTALRTYCMLQSRTRTQHSSSDSSGHSKPAAELQQQQHQHCSSSSNRPAVVAVKLLFVCCSACCCC